MTTPTPIPSLPTVLTASQERIWALVAHLSMILFWFFGPLIMWIAGRDRSPYVDDQGKEALNFSISLSIVYAGSIAMTFAAFTVWWLAIAGVIIMGVATLAWFIMPFIGAAAAYRGDIFRYPLTIRLFR
jgi:uncharacterized Tic20 family protein